MIAGSLPYWPVDPTLTSSPWYTFQLDMARCLMGDSSASAFWGASFPLALAACGRPWSGPGEGSGKGSMPPIPWARSWARWASVLILVPMWGTQHSQQVLLAIALSVRLRRSCRTCATKNRLAIAGLLAASMVLSMVLLFALPAVPGELIAYGRRMPSIPGNPPSFTPPRDGIRRWRFRAGTSGEIYINVNGHVEATTEIYDMKLQRMVGHLPGLLHPNPKSVLGIGFGAGVSAGTFTRYPGIEHITICEIEPVIPPTSTRFFAKQNYEVMNNPKTRIVYDDARHYVMTTTNKYDIIASDPLDVFAKGTAALYSKEYFDAVKAHLNPGGYFSLYVPLYESDLRTGEERAGHLLSNRFRTPPCGPTPEWRRIRHGLHGPGGAAEDQCRRSSAGLDRPDYAPVAKSLREVGVPSTIELVRDVHGPPGRSGAMDGGRGHQPRQ
jgi:spermidine synthase